MAGQQQHPHRRLQVGLLDPALELGDQAARQPVAALGAVEREPGDGTRDLVLKLVHAASGSARSMIALASTPAGSVP